jgi:hypothetical protein
MDCDAQEMYRAGWDPPVLPAIWIALSFRFEHRS